MINNEKKCEILDFENKILNKSEEILKEEIGKVVVRSRKLKKSTNNTKILNNIYLLVNMYVKYNALEKSCIYKYLRNTENSRVNNTRNLDLIQQINCVVQYRDIFTKDNNMQKFLSTINLHAKKFFNYIIGVLRLEPVEISRLRTAILIY
ncbi:hypothetical protein CWI37_0729p0010 [Hamiltosporidium tvaerminnensis]|uniref:Uncharacterized protein n=1 Tax=Hamiltosporidium tvaerminnensis TaxID=1176355 RepID=A0A4Q9L1V1_9MICR|nr:hypothetical protein CWI37_0729p0010 [Hamiltosporidium tvaerminnensis]